MIVKIYENGHYEDATARCKVFEGVQNIETIFAEEIETTAISLQRKGEEAFIVQPVAWMVILSDRGDLVSTFWAKDHPSKQNSAWNKSAKRQAQ